MGNRTRAISASQILIPELTSDELQGLKDYWKVYEIHRDDITTALMGMAGDHPEFKVILQNQTYRQTEAERNTGIELQQRAIFEGEWEPYLKNLRIQGMLYAQTGLSFQAWFEIVGAFRRYMVPHLLDSYGKSPKHLLSVMNGMDRFIDIVMGVVGESYLSTKEKLILQQKEFLQESQGQLAGIINSAMDAIITINESQRIMIFNPAAEKMFGYTVDEVQGKPLTMLIPDRLGQKHEVDVRTFGQTSVTKRAMGRLGMVFGLRANGEEFPLEVSISQIEIAGGKTYTAILRDISERQKIEKALRDNEQLYRSTLDNMLEGAQIVDSEWRYVYLNDAAVRHGRNTRENLIGHRMSEVYPDIENTEMYSILQRCMRDGVSRKMLNEFTYPDGEKRWFELSIQPSREGLFILSNDITERKRAEDALHESEEKLRVAVKNSNFIPAQFDRELRYRWIYNPHPDFDPSQVIGKRDDELEDSEGVKRLVALKRRVIESGEGMREEVSFQRSDGIHTYDFTIEPLRNTNGDVVGATSAAFDVTERKHAEEEVRRLNEELEQRVKLRTTQLEAANKELEAFSYSVSHDLRAPLRGIDGFSQALLEDYFDELPKEGQDYLNRIRAAAQRMARLIDDMLKLSRISRSSMEFSVVDLSALVRDIADVLQQEESDRKVAFSIAPGLQAEADERLMKIVLENLLGNAWKFTSKNDEQALIEFGAEEREGEQVFYIRDNGSGFDMSYVDKLFGAFQRLHSTSEFPGTGIGLATVQRIIHRHGGRVWAEGTLNRGATFYFTL